MARWVFFCVVAIAVPLAAPSSDQRYPTNYVGAALVQLNDNGGWSWFMDPRVIVNEGKLIIGSVRAVGSNQANGTDPRSGNVEVSVYEIETGATHTVVLHPHLEQDDHDAPAFYVRTDGRILATAIAWMRGAYVHNHGEWYSSVVAAIVPPAASATRSQ